MGKKRKEADKVLADISNFNRTRAGFNPCDDSTYLAKYPRVKSACKIQGKTEAQKVDLVKQAQAAEMDKQTASLVAGAAAPDPTAAATSAGAGATPAGGATPPPPADDMTKYYIIGGVGLVLVGGVAFFLLRTPSSGAAAPAPAK